MNFLLKYNSLFDGTEVPDLFATWSGISCISAMLERRVWIDMNIFTIYPNMFIIFVADSGRMRKSTAIEMTRKLLSKTNPSPRMIAQKITPEGLIDSLKTVQIEGKTVKESCGGLVVASELVTFINKDAYERGMGGLMIELWDCPDKYEYRTRNRPVEEIHHGHLSLLGGTTVHSLKDAIPIQAMGDGFTSRILFIYVDETPIPVPRPTQKPEFAKVEEELVQHLQSISSIGGEVKLSKDAIKLFDAEYRRFWNSKFFDDPQFQAYASRRDKHLLKVAMCLMAADRKPDDPLVIKQFDLEGAIVLLSDLEEHIGHIFDRIAMTETGSMTERVFSAINTSPNKLISRADILKKFSHKLSAQDLTKIIETLCQAQRITPDTWRGSLRYKISDDPNRASDRTE